MLSTRENIRFVAGTVYGEVEKETAGHKVALFKVQNGLQLKRCLVIQKSKQPFKTEQNRY